MNLKPLVSLAVLCLVLGACNRQGPDVPKGVDDNRTLQDPGDGVEAVVVNPDAAHVGSAVDGAGEIVEPATRFDVGQTVYISVPTKFGLRDGQRLEVFWFHDDGHSRKDDTRKIEGPFTVFEWIASDVGAYNVEVAVDNRPIALVQFEVE